MNRKFEDARSLSLRGIRDGRFREAVADYAGGRSMRHGTGSRDGRGGCTAFSADVVERNATRDIRLVCGFGDGRCVLLHALPSLNVDESRWVTGDFFYTEEHDRGEDPNTHRGTSSVSSRA